MDGSSVENNSSTDILYITPFVTYRGRSALVDMNNIRFICSDWIVCIVMLH
jgi:hypothetical protein